MVASRITMKLRQHDEDHPGGKALAAAERSGDSLCAYLDDVLLADVLKAEAVEVDDPQGPLDALRVVARRLDHLCGRAAEKRR